MKTQALVIRSYGRRFVVEIDGTEYSATTRGKRVDYAVGDVVDVTVQNAEQVVIEAAQPRQTLLYRQDEWKTKIIAANVSRVLLVTAAVPSPSEELVGRCLIACEAEGISPVILVNKSDLPETAAWLAKLELYRELGYPVVPVSALEGADAVRPLLEGHTSVLVGQSGMGKSTLTNALLPEACARVGDISSALDSGRHTTTNATLYHLDTTSQLIDSPGLQAFGLAHIAATDFIHYFPEMRALIGHCRFHNCTHRNEPGCAVKDAAAEGKIAPQRLALLQKLISASGQVPA